MRPSYTVAVAWWAIDILVFEMLCGSRPFEHAHINTLYGKDLDRFINFRRQMSDGARFHRVAVYEGPTRQLASLEAGART
jgi:hypothetical protein